MSKMSKTIEDFILDEVQDKLDLLEIPRDSVDPSFDLVLSGALDSIGFIELVGALEDEFQFQIDFEKFEHLEFTTLARLVMCSLASMGFDGA